MGKTSPLLTDPLARSFWPGTERNPVEKSPSASASLYRLHLIEPLFAYFLRPVLSFSDEDEARRKELYGPRGRSRVLHALTATHLHCFKPQVWERKQWPVLSVPLDIHHLELDHLGLFRDGLDDDAIHKMTFGDVHLAGTPQEIENLHNSVVEVQRARAVGITQQEVDALYYAKLEQRRQHAERLREEELEEELERRKDRPSDMPIRTPRDAEQVAEAWLRFWGFLDAEMTPVGADEGIDVTSEGAVAQVKAQSVQIGRPEIQGLFGAAAHLKKQAFFFSLGGYTAQAVDWAEKAGVALFEFDLMGSPKPANGVARSFPT